MGISAGGSKGGPKSDMNVTPLVDVVLVLLIIFLVTTPIMMRQITVDVPRKLDDEEIKRVVTSKHLTVTVHAMGTVTINDGSKDKTINRVELASTIRPMLDEISGEKIVFIDFDDELKYSEAVSAMDTLKGSGAEKVALKIREDAPAAP